MGPVRRIQLRRTSPLRTSSLVRSSPAPTQHQAPSSFAMSCLPRTLLRLLPSRRRRTTSPPAPPPTHSPNPNLLKNPAHPHSITNPVPHHLARSFLFNPTCLLA
ncbi:hypothetical protein U1Q18_024232 [Sarracenia purpurea var. burkii]